MLSYLEGLSIFSIRKIAQIFHNKTVKYNQIGVRGLKKGVRNRIGAKGTDSPDKSPGNVEHPPLLTSQTAIAYTQPK